jgi:hypothetical protein
MDETQVLTSVAEVAIAIAGFSGIVAVFRRTDEGSWPPDVRLRLTLLILSSLTTAAYAFLPLVVWEILRSEDRVWRASSSAWAIFAICFIVWARSHVARLRAEEPDFRQQISLRLFRHHGVCRLPLLHRAFAC